MYSHKKYKLKNKKKNYNKSTSNLRPVHPRLQSTNYLPRYLNVKINGRKTLSKPRSPGRALFLRRKKLLIKKNKKKVKNKTNKNEQKKKQKKTTIPQNPQRKKNKDIKKNKKKNPTKTTT